MLVGKNVDYAHQTKAVTKAQRVVAQPHGRGMLLWHSAGSGKTHTPLAAMFRGHPSRNISGASEPQYFGRTRAAIFREHPSRNISGAPEPQYFGRPSAPECTPEVHTKVLNNNEYSLGFVIRDL